MAKDPATLWYWNDWHSGTILMSRHLKGCYMDLLHAQFHHGPLSLEQIKTILGQDQASWTVLSSKFKKVTNSEGSEVFLNERLELEKENRRKNSKKQKENALMRWHKYGNANIDTKTLPLEDENENEIENKDEIVNYSFGKFENLLTEVEINSTIEFVSITANKILKTKEVENYWTAFGIHSEKKYSTRSERLQHFRSWLKIQIQTNGTYQQTSTGGKPGTSEARVDGLKKWGG